MLKGSTAFKGQEVLSNWYHQNIFNTSITNVIKLEIQPRLLESAEQNLTLLPYPSTQSLLPSPLKPQLNTSP